MKAIKKSNHEFALFIDDQLQKQLIITDKDFVFRVQHIVRLSEDDTLIVFNKTHHARATYIKGDKKQIVFELVTIVENVPLVPKIHWFLPVLEREAFEAALYSATVLGATSIQPIITEKSRRQWGADKDLERATRIMIAAAEQSKQYVLPHIKQAVVLASLAARGERGVVASNPFEWQNNQIKKIFFDPTGAPCAQLLHHIKDTHEIILCIGPEGDLTDSEKSLLKNNNFQFYALTPTILRACDAVMVAQGIIRSLV